MRIVKFSSKNKFVKNKKNVLYEKDFWLIIFTIYGFRSDE